MKHEPDPAGDFADMSGCWVLFWLVVAFTTLAAGLFLAYLLG